jgi:exosortase
MPLTIAPVKWGSQGSRILLLSILGTISVAIWWKPLLVSFALSLREEQYTHLLLVLPVTIALMFAEWQSRESSEGFADFPSIIGMILLATALLVELTTRLHFFQLPRDEQLSLEMLALVLYWSGSLILCFGRRVFPRALFPLLFLLWIVPLPQVVLDPIVSLLQEGSVASAHFLFSATGVPVAQTGTQLTIAGLTVEVAPECSSIRSSLMLLLTTMVLTQIALRSIWRKALIIAIAIPLSVAKNGLRIFVLALLTTRIDHSFISGKLHRQGGIIYFMIALAAIILLVWIAHWTEHRANIPVTKPPKLPERASAVP